jgi:hypothetical protein
MTAMTLDQLSGGRMLLGLGLSGPQVVEGWHGVAYGKPLGKTREYVAIVRKILARREPLVHAGEHYRIPYAGDDATGLGKPLKSILHGRADLPIYLAAIGPKNVELAAEIADGWLPIFFSPADFDAVYRAPVEAGFAKAGGGKTHGRFRHCTQRAGGSGRRRRRLPRLNQALPGALCGRHGRARARTSTTTWPAATASPRPPTASRISILPARSRQPLRPFPTRWWTRSRSAGRRSASPNGSPPGRPARSPRSASRPSILLRCK